MKFISFFLLLLLSSTITATEYQAKYHSCSELNRFLSDDGVISIRYQTLFKPRRTHYASSNSCSACFRSSPATLKASDKWCRVGFVCAKRSQDWIERENRRRRDRGQRRLDCRRRD
jgi:hypothetical protein